LAALAVGEAVGEELVDHLVAPVLDLGGHRDAFDRRDLAGRARGQGGECRDEDAQRRAGDGGGFGHFEAHCA
jgi:hypothetical protein